jgi:hypothetical protein
MTVISAHEMRLRSTAHPSYVLDSFHRHGGILAFSNQQSVVDTLNTAKKIFETQRRGVNGGMQDNQIECPLFSVPLSSSAFQSFADLLGFELLNTYLGFVLADS